MIDLNNQESQLLFTLYCQLSKVDVGKKNLWHHIKSSGFTSQPAQLIQKNPAIIGKISCDGGQVTPKAIAEKTFSYWVSEIDMIMKKCVFS